MKNVLSSVNSRQIARVLSGLSLAASLAAGSASATTTGTPAAIPAAPAFECYFKISPHHVPLMSFVQLVPKGTVEFVGEVTQQTLIIPASALPAFSPYNQSAVYLESSTATGKLLKVRIKFEKQGVDLGEALYTNARKPDALVGYFENTVFDSGLDLTVECSPVDTQN